MADDEEARTRRIAGRLRPWYRRYLSEKRAREQEQETSAGVGS